MLRNSATTWGGVSKTLHWSIVTLIAVTVPAGYLMTYTYGLAVRNLDALPLHNFFCQVHHTIGFSILVLVVGRLAWRLSGEVPTATPERFSGQRRIAGLTHLTLYALLFVLPLSGWAALSVYGKARIWLFNQEGVVPPILPAQPLRSTFGYGAFAHLHVWAVWLGAAVVLVHVAAALWHHWGRRDTVFRRMWPLGEVTPRV